MIKNHTSNEFIATDPIDHSVGLDNEEGSSFEYERLKGHIEPDFRTWKSDQELRLEYLQLTDELIRKMTEGTDMVDPETGKNEKHVPSVVIFLDKSGRPLSHFVRELWPVFAKDPATGEVPPMPKFNFLNIDREQWINKIDSQGTGLMDVNLVDSSIIQNLRSIFVKPEYKDRLMNDGVTEEVNDMATLLDGEKVLIVDETFSTGRTTKVATALLKNAFPATYFGAAHWMQKSYGRDGAKYNSVPVWYDSTTVMGRGVSDRYVDVMTGRELDEISKDNFYRKVGKFFLSAPHGISELQNGMAGVRDERYLQLVREIKELASNPDIPVIPSLKRNDFDERLLAYNGHDATSLSYEQKQDKIGAIVQQKRAISDASALEAKKKISFRRR